MTERPSESGFTLVETLVSLAILCGVLIATYSALVDALSATARVAARRQAVAAVAAQVEMMRAGRAVPVGTAQGVTHSYRWWVRVEPLPVPAGTWLHPLRITGEIAALDGAAAPEAVVDTVTLDGRP